MKIIFVLVMLTFFLTGCSNQSTKEPDNVGNYSIQNLSLSKENSKPQNAELIETDLATFSTKISQPDPNRQTNITLTCQALNGTIVKMGETFSFCNTLGPAKPEDGYLKADTFDSDGNTIKAYGGGKCQVSTTLYNAVLACSGLIVVERHEHSGEVYYVPEGKDACVAYGSCDFKFRNDNNFDIKMYFTNTPDNIDVKIVKISS